MRVCVRVYDARNELTVSLVVIHLSHHAEVSLMRVVTSVRINLLFHALSVAAN